MDARLAIRLPKELLRAIDDYCKENYLDRSTVMRQALLHYGPLGPHIKKQKKKSLADEIEDF